MRRWFCNAEERICFDIKSDDSRGSVCVRERLLYCCCLCHWPWVRWKLLKEWGYKRRRGKHYKTLQWSNEENKKGKAKWIDRFILCVRMIEKDSVFESCSGCPTPPVELKKFSFTQAVKVSNSLFVWNFREKTVTYYTVLYQQSQILTSF